MHASPRNLAGFGLAAVGAVLVMAAGSALALDLFGDAYPDTILDHPLETGVTVAGGALVTAGLLLVRGTSSAGRARSPVKPARVIAGIVLALVAFVLAYGFSVICGFGCSRGEYWSGIALFALLAAAGLFLIAQAVPSQRP